MRGKIAVDCADFAVGALDPPKSIRERSRTGREKTKEKTLVEKGKNISRPWALRLGFHFASLRFASLRFASLRLRF